VPRPLITAVSPGSGPQAGNTLVTISGLGFDAPVEVLFGDQAGAVQSTTPESITVRTPVFAIEFNTQACDDSPGDGQQGERFVPTAVDVSVENLTTGCQDDSNDAFVVVPTDQSCRNDEAAVDPPTASFNAQNAGGNSVLFQNTSTGGAPLSFQWDFQNDGVVDSTATNPTFNYGAPGVYTVRLVASNSRGSDEDVQAITVPVP
jgi:PKD repeat protein